jgi:hypothetical protein
MDDTRNEYAQLGQEFKKILSSETELNGFLNHVLSRYLTPREVAMELGVTRGRVQQMMTEGKLSYATTPYGRIIPKMGLKRYRLERLLDSYESAEKQIATFKANEQHLAAGLFEGLLHGTWEDIEKLLIEMYGPKVVEEYKQEIAIVCEGLPPGQAGRAASDYARMSSEQRAKVLENARRNLAEKQQDGEAESEVKDQ